MQKYCCLGILCIVLLALCACGEAAAPEPTSTAATTAVTTEATKAKPTVDYPASYKDAPEAYKPILDDLYKCSQLVVRDDYDQIDTDYALGETKFGWYHPGPPLGYMILDMNKDGISELLIASGKPEEESLIWSLFTLKDNKPVYVISNSWLDRCDWFFLVDGTIYQVGGGGSFYTFVSSYQLQPGATELTKLTDFWRDCNLEYYCSEVNGKREYITEKQFESMHDRYSNPPNLMKLKFIPIDQ